jgi:NACalpha-BTF3-like transcription factor
MDVSVVRTHPKDIQLLSHLYTMLHPQELNFLIELNKRWSVYDPSRIENLTIILRKTFGVEYKQADIEQVIMYFESPDSIQFYSPVTVDMALAQVNQTFHLNPYQSKCPICLSLLDATMADVLSVRVYNLSGKIDHGKE